MGMLALRNLMAMQRQRQRRRHRRKAQARVITSVDKRKGRLLQGSDSSQGGKRSKYSGPDLPEDIWYRIHSLMPLPDAARAACVSQAFLSSWRRHPNLILTKKTMGLEQKSYRKVGMAGNFTSTIDHILRTHSGIGVKRLKLNIIYDHRNLSICYLNKWLQIAITPGIEEITLLLPSKYSFPCSLLSGGSGRGRISLSSFQVFGFEAVDTQTLQTDNRSEDTIFARATQLPRINTPMVASKFLHLKCMKIHFDSLDSDEAFPLEYDYLSLVSILDASPVLNTFILSVEQGDMKHDSVFGDASNLRVIPGHKHDSLKDVKIIGFCSATSMVELTCYIFENAASLESITLDTVCDLDDFEDIGRCCTTTLRKNGTCFPLRREMILEAHRGLMAIESYIRGKVPCMVELTVREPCTWCHDIERFSRR
uniref:F-box domain-containing protein n=1 Tax=Leersia perrieri TaxID=77586 RepID=A0A0D9XFA2_9ORYZ